jgi:hypothetical protein
MTLDKSKLLTGTYVPGTRDTHWDFLNKDTGAPLGSAPISSYAKVMVDRAKRKVAEEARAGGQRGPTEDPKGEAPSSSSDTHTFALLTNWIDSGPLRLEKVHHSVAHRIVPMGGLPLEAHVLLINHNWAALLNRAAISGAAGPPSYRLPYPCTVFEFFFTGGVHAVCVATQPNEDITASTHFCIKSIWFKAETEITYDDHGVLQNPGDLANSPLLKAYDLITANIFAISVMLEAEVAEATPISEAYKRNRERPVRKELPGMSHHVVSLARRPRSSRAPYPGEPRISPRLHFRRGHWRHFSSHRTWIKWQLVGDPDLGFIEKEYGA